MFLGKSPNHNLGHSAILGIDMLGSDIQIRNSLSYTCSDYQNNSYNVATDENAIYYMSTERLSQQGSNRENNDRKTKNDLASL